ncbi:MAG: hypothetical protein IID45_14905 [Planctomycetes bacterium]|nr:hypothetical protein [Planctomycetota bacterium]
MPYFTKPKKDVCNFVLEVMRRYHKILTTQKVTIGVLAAWQTEAEEKKEEPPLKLNGYKCAATVALTKHKDRVLGVEDAVITIDANFWKDSGDEVRAALIDHELTHLLCVTDKHGVYKKDDGGRPKLSVRLHDFQIGGFYDIIERHGDFAVEKKYVDFVVAKMKQLNLPFEAA